MKKYIFTTILLSCVYSMSMSQVMTSLAVNNPPATLSDWANTNSAVIYTVENISAVTRQFIIKAEITTADGTVVATKDLSRAQVFSVQGTRIFFAKEVLPLDIMIFSGNYKTTLERTGQLPSGTYLLNVQLVEPGMFGPMSTLQSRVFNLTAPQLPYLITPVNNDSLNARKSETAIIFRWTPLTPQPQAQPYYRLQVFEILPFQQPMQALRGNQPLLDQTVRGITQYIWRPQMDLSTDTLKKRFIWTVQTLNANRQPYIPTQGNGESRSEPFIFFIKD